MTNSEVEIMLLGLRQEGMANAFRELMSNSGLTNMTFTEKVAKMCLSQKDLNASKKLARLKRAAKFKFDAFPEDIIWGQKIGLDKERFRNLLFPDWVARMENVILTGSTGTGKTWLACAIGNALVRQDIPVRYIRVKPLLEAMRGAHLDGTTLKLRRSLAKPKLLILDDFGISSISESAKEDLFEIIEARTDAGSTLIAGQLSPQEWHDYLQADHLADAIMDRLIQRSHVFNLKGDSMRSRL